MLQVTGNWYASHLFILSITIHLTFPNFFGTGGQYVVIALELKVDDVMSD